MNRYKLLALIAAGALAGHLLGYDIAQSGIVSCLVAAAFALVAGSVRVVLAIYRRGGVK